MANPILDAARAYIAKGWYPIPLSRNKGAGKSRGKQPKAESGWNKPDYYEDVARIPEQYFKPNDNLGVLLAPSGLADVDLDSPEARRLAEEFLPPTSARFGRKSAPLSHWLYRIRGDLPTTVEYQDPAPQEQSANLVELRCLSSRGTSVQSMFPPSVHIASGEVVAWACESDAPEPAEVDAAELLTRVQRLAAAALLCRRWKDGMRHELALRTAGALAYAGWSESDAAHFILAVAAAAGDRELSDRRRAVADTYEAVRRGAPATGLPKLAELLGDAAAKKLVEWLSLRRESDAKPAGANGEREAASLRLAAAALAAIHELFLTPANEVYLTLRQTNHLETHALDSPTVERFLYALCVDLQIAPRESVITEALAWLRGHAHKGGVVKPVHLRVAGDLTSAIYIDLGRPDWKIAEVTPAGWRIIEYGDCPVCFYRPEPMRALPIPTPGRIEDLRAFLRLGDAEFLLVVGWLLAALRPPVASYPVLALRGAHGSGKSTTTRLLRSLIDPSDADLAPTTRNIEDLLLWGENAHLLALDNLTRVPESLMNTLCVIATGGSLPRRMLYHNKRLSLLRVRRPLIVNGIPDLLTRGDFSSRAIQVELPVFEQGARRTEYELWQAWESARAGIFGALLSGVSRALRDFRQIPTADDRLADFVQWAAAGVQAYGFAPEQFLKAYTANRQTLEELLIDRDTVAHCILALMDGRDRWTGTASELLKALQEVAEDVEKQQLPRAPHILANKLRELKPTLQACGIDWVWRRGAKGRREHILWRKSASPASPASPEGDFELKSGGETGDASGDAAAREASPQASPANEADLNSTQGVGDAGDAGDALIPDYGEARRQVLLRRYLLQQGYLIEGDSEAARAQREALLLQAAADAGYPALSLNGRRTGDGEAYWRMQTKAIAARPLESAICIELFRRAADGSLRRCLDCGGRFSSESALFCYSCRECAGTCPYCRGRRTQIFDGDTGLCHACRRRFPLPAVQPLQGEESIPHSKPFAQGMESPANEGGVNA